VRDWGNWFEENGKGWGKEGLIDQKYQPGLVDFLVEIEALRADKGSNFILVMGNWRRNEKVM
jgi:hypothetical protein